MMTHEHRVESAAEYLASTDFDRYIDACDTFGITPAKWSVWWARYGDDYRAQIKIAVAEQLIEEVAVPPAGGLLGTIVGEVSASAPDTSPAPSVTRFARGGIVSPAAISIVGERRWPSDDSCAPDASCRHAGGGES